MTKQQITGNLCSLLDKEPALKDALEKSLAMAARPGIETISEFQAFVEKILTHIPVENELIHSVREFYYVLGKSPNNFLFTHTGFNNWINDVVVSRGDWLNTPESAASIDTFVKNPEYHAGDYINGPGGWLSFNQFLARQLKPGRRPITERCNDSVIVSPVDCKYMGVRTIHDDSTVSVKGKSYSITSLLSGSVYAEKFRGGVFTHGFLAITDYHRFHMPTSGLVMEVKNIPGKTWVTEQEKPDATLENIDDIGFQFSHTRALVVIKSSAGFIAVIPVGMGHISSVVLTCDEGTYLQKGDEFGYFAFGGSDMILLFEKDKAELIMEKDRQYKMGELVGRAFPGAHEADKEL